MEVEKQLEYESSDEVVKPRRDLCGRKTRLIALTLRAGLKHSRLRSAVISDFAIPLYSAVVFFLLETFAGLLHRCFHCFSREITDIISGYRYKRERSAACTGHVSVFCNPRNRTATRARVVTSTCILYEFRWPYTFNDAFKSPHLIYT